MAVRYTNEAVGAENYGTISYLVESSHKSGVFYSGSDDGFVYITQNNGSSWQNITPKNLGETLINAIEVSPHDPATVYIATTKYKLGDYAPALYKSTNYGKSWTNISSGIPNGAYTRVVREDEMVKGLLYAGTEQGIYISFNNGASWEPFQLNLPVTPITDLKVHRNDLIVATSGRSFWILDNLSLLAQFQQNKTDFKLFTPEPVVYGNWGSAMGSDSFSGMQDFEGVNPVNGVELYYYLPTVSETEVITLTITNAEGKVVNTYTSAKDETYIPHNGGSAPPAPLLSKKEGLNRFVWNMQHAIVPGVPGVYIEAGFEGHKVIPGAYIATLHYDDKTIEKEIVIKNNEAYTITSAQFAEYDTFMNAVERTATEMHQKVNTLKTAQDDILALLKRMKDTNKSASLITEGEALLKELQAWDEEMVQRRSQAYDDVENFENKFTAEYLFLMNQTDGSIPRVNQANKDRKAELDAQWQQLKTTANELLNSKIPAYNKKLWEAGYGAIKL